MTEKSCFGYQLEVSGVSLPEYNATQCDGNKRLLSKASGPTSPHEHIIPSSVIEERTGREAHHSTPPSTELKKDPLCVASTIRLHGVLKDLE